MSAKKSRPGTKNPGHPVKPRTSKATGIQKPRNKEAQSFDGPGYFLGEINRATFITLAYINATLSSNENKQAESMQAGHDFCMELRDLILRRMKEEPELDLPPKLRRTVKSQNSANGEFDSWEYLEESSRKK